MKFDSHDVDWFGGTLRLRESVASVLCLLSLSILLLITYWPALYNGFVWLDYSEIIQGNLIFHSAREMVDLFQHDHNYAGYHRPINDILHTIDVFVWGYNPFGHHLSSVLLHILNALLVFMLAARFLHSKAMAFAGALLWGTHPANAATVGLVGSRADLGVASLILMTALLSLNGLRRGGRQGTGFYVAGLVCYILALLTKEVAFAFPLIATIVFMVQRHRQRDMGAAAIRPPSVLMAIWWITSVSLIIRLFITPLQVYHSSLSIGERLLTFLSVYVEYFKNMVLPNDVVVSDTVNRFYLLGFEKQFNVVFAFVGLIVIQIILVFRISSARVAIAIYNVFLVPVAQILPTLHFRSDRFLYLPSVGFVLAGVVCVASLLQTVLPHRGIHQRYRLVLISGAIYVGVIYTYSELVSKRLERFRDNMSLFSHEVAKTPGYREGLCLLATEYDKFGNYSHAEVFYRRCLAARPELMSYVDMDAAIVNLTNNLLLQHKAFEVEAVARAMGSSVKNPKAREELAYNVAVAAIQNQQYEAALPVLIEYGRNHPGDAGCQYLVGVAAMALDQFSTAELAFRSYLKLAPAAENREEIESWLKVAAQH